MKIDEDLKKQKKFYKKPTPSSTTNREANNASQMSATSALKRNINNTSPSLATSMKRGNWKRHGRPSSQMLKVDLD